MIKRLVPGMPGTQRLQERFGNALVCVRYREDEAGGRRLTTVELVVSDRPARQPRASLIKIAYNETELRRRVCAAGGEWDAERKLWRLPRAAVRALALESRVVKISTNGN